MTLFINSSRSPKHQLGLGCLPIFGLLLLTVVLTIATTVWALNSSWLNSKFNPTRLSNSEQVTLTKKLDALGGFETTGQHDQLENTEFQPEMTADPEELQPELYSEDQSKRRIALTERELNALLAQNTDLGEQVVIKLIDNMASVKLLVDLDPDFPFIGGKTLKVSSGTELSYANNQPAVVLKGVSVWGIPIPNAS